MKWQSWNRVLGLSSRAIFLTTQRLLDVAAVVYSGEGKGPSTAPMIFGLLLSTLLMVVTMRTHWMADKVISGGRPRPKYRVLDSEASQPLLPLASAPDPLSNPPKGSPGENAMRGVSAQLFFVNIVFFDPGMHFLYVNQVFYVMKYLEFVIMWRCIQEARFLRPHNRWNEEIAMLPNGFLAELVCVACDAMNSCTIRWYHGLFFFCVFFVLLNAVFVWKLVPERRRQKDQRYFSPSPAWHGHGEQASNAPAAGEPCFEGQTLRGGNWRPLPLPFVRKEYRPGSTKEGKA
eukprot:s691_g7.t1